MNIQDDYARRLADEILRELGKHTSASEFHRKCVEMRRNGSVSEMEMDDCSFPDIYIAVHEGFLGVSGRHLTSVDIPAINRAWNIVRAELADFGRA